CNQACCNAPMTTVITPLIRRLAATEVNLLEARLKQTGQFYRRLRNAKSPRACAARNRQQGPDSRTLRSAAALSHNLHFATAERDQRPLTNRIVGIGPPC